MTRRHTITALATATALTAALAGCSGGSGSGPSAASTGAPSPTVSSAPTTAHPAPTTHAPTAKQVRAAVTSRLHTIMSKQPSGAVSVAALNTRTGQRFAAGRTSGMWTASAYKLFCLSALLIGRSASSLSGSEVDSAQRAIENSDNVAGYQLFLDAGGRPGLESAADRFGMHHTVPGESDPTFTTTSGPDYLKLLEAITGRTKNDPLGHSARQFILNLMGEVENDQRWGSARPPRRARSSTTRTGGSRSRTATAPARTTAGSGPSPASAC